MQSDELCEGSVAPTGLELFWEREPRALPWAIICRAFSPFTWLAWFAVSSVLSPLPGFAPCLEMVRARTQGERG